MLSRSSFIKNLIGLYGLGSLSHDWVKHYQKIYLLQCFVRGFQYYNGPTLLKSIRATGMLELVRERQNKHDLNAIALHFNRQKIGYIPKESNAILSVLLDTALLELQAEISHVEPKAATWENVRIAVYALKEVPDTVHEYKGPYTMLETPSYYTLRSEDDAYARIYFDENDPYWDEPYGYERMIEKNFHAQFVKVRDKRKDMQKEIEESRFVVDLQKIPGNIAPETVIATEDEIFLKSKGRQYASANIGRIMTMHGKIERLIKHPSRLSRDDKTLYEIIFSP